VGHPAKAGVLSRKEAVAFLRKRTGTTDKQAAAALAEALEDLPLALPITTSSLGCCRVSEPTSNRRQSSRPSQPRLLWSNEDQVDRAIDRWIDGVDRRT
jgi:hypothetical protein